MKEVLYHMKRMIAAGMACMLLMTPAFAETAAETEAAEAVSGAEIGQDMEASLSYEGKWITVDTGKGTAIDIFLPAAWEEKVLTDDAAEAEEETEAEAEAQRFYYDETAHYVITGGEDEWGLSVAWAEREGDADAQEVCDELSEEHEDAAVVTLNGVEWVRYTDAEADNVILLLPEEGGMHIVAVGPASDAEFEAQRDEIITTISAYAIEQEA